MPLASESGSQNAPAEIQCSGCGRTVRLQPERAGLKQRCPVCKRLTPHPRHGEFVRERRRFTYAFAALGILGLIPLTWPVGLYLLAVSIIAFVFQLLKYGREESGADKSTNKWRVLTFNSSKALRDTASSVGAGMAVVCVAQLLLRTLLFFADPQTVHDWEDWIVSKKAGLAGLLEFKWMLLTLAAMILISLIWPSTKPVTRYRSLRSWASRLLVALTVISSFTFFTSNAIMAGERDWVAERRDEYKKAAAKVRSARETLAKAVHLKERLGTLSDKSRRDLGDFFDAAHRSPDWKRIIEDLAKDVADKMPPGKGPTEYASRAGNSPQDVRSDDSPIEISLERIERWDVNDPASTTASTPTFEDGKRVTEEARNYDNAVGEAEAALEEAVKSVVGDQLSSIVDLDPLIKPFAKTLIGSGVKTFFPKGILRRIRNFRDADSLITLDLTPKQKGSAWDLAIGKVAHYEKPTSAPITPVPKVADSKTPNVLSGLDELIAPSGRLPRLTVNPLDKDFPAGLSSGAGGLRGSRQIEKCCEMCTYRSGILTGCIPMGCGPQCAGAR